MFKNYIKIAWRNLYKNKVFSLIHVLGLTIGITVCMMIFLYIMNEFSVDNFQKDRKHIYRVMRGFENGKIKVPYLAGPYAAALLNDFPNDIKTAVRVWHANFLVSFNDKAFNERDVYAADPEFFTMFSFPLIKGNPADVLKDPSGLVLTEKIAKKYFGTVDNAMGKVVQLDKGDRYKVTGIAKDVPSNSHLSFDIIVAIGNFARHDDWQRWINNKLFVYVRLSDKADPARLEKQFVPFMQKYMGADMAKMGVKFSLALTALPDIYFEPSTTFDHVKHGDKTVVYIFLSIAILIMIIACINFMNLATIRAVERSKEVGLRKVLGAMRNHLVAQFMGESLLLALISCTLSVGLLLLFMPYYNQLLGYKLTVSWNAAPIYLFLIGVILVVGLLAGSYPALVLSAFSPIQALKGKLKLGKGGVFFRQTLVVLQFSISVFLIIGTVVISRQMNFMKSKNLGYDQEQHITIAVDNNDIYNHLSTFKNELLSNNNISGVSVMSGEPGGYFDIMGFAAEGQREVFRAHTEYADADFVKTLGLKIIAGRNFSGLFKTDSTDAVLINRTAAGKLGYTPSQAVGKSIKNTVRDNAPRRIVGVVEDFNFLSLKENLDALIISPAEDWRVIVVKLKPGNIRAGVDFVKAEYAKVAPMYPFEYSFMNKNFDDIYKNDLRQQMVISIFSGLAIFIACLGLFGLASFTAVKRTKEIGVRKVLGSSVGNILLLLSTDLLKPVLTAAIIAMPVGYYCMNKWLQNFAYKTVIDWQVFSIAAGATLLIAFAAISFQSVKAAIANPVKSLRSE